MERILRSKTEPPIHGFDSMGQFVWSRLQQLDGQSVCLIEALTDERLTVSELKTRANSIAVALIETGITKADKIAFCGQNSIQHLVLRFTTHLLGNAILPLSPTFLSYEVETRVRDIGANVIMCSANDFNKINAILNNNKQMIKLVVIFDGKHDKHLTYDQLLVKGKGQSLKRIPYFDVTSDDICILANTSGTSGASKCALISNKMLVNSTYSDVSPVSTIVGIPFPLGHMSGSIMITANLLRGNTVVLLLASNEELMLRSIGKYAIKLLVMYPYFGKRILDEMDAKRYDLSSLTEVNSRGAQLSSKTAIELIKRCGLKINDGYGMTEYCRIALFSNAGEEYIPDSVGQVSPGTQVKIVDTTTDQCLGPGIDGEICVRGDKMFSGYLDNIKALDSEGWLKTGDIGHYDHMERLFLTGRMKEMFDVYVDNQFKRVFPEEIEHFLLTHESIAEVVVIGVKNRIGAHWPRAYVALKAGHTVSADAIQQFVSETLSSIKHLKAGVVFVDDFQRTISGKVERKYYRNLVMNEVLE